MIVFTTGLIASSSEETEYTILSGMKNETMVMKILTMGVKITEILPLGSNVPIIHQVQVFAILTAETESVIPLRLLSNVTMETT